MTTGGASSGRPTTLPGARELAEMLRDGVTADEIADAYGVAPVTVTQKISRGGYSSVTGQAFVRREPYRRQDAHPLTIPGEWRFDAACDPTTGDEFHVERGGDTRPAKKVCKPCPVRQECLTFALVNDEKVGIWGGLTRNERRALQKKGLTSAPMVEPDPDGRRKCPHCDDTFVYLARLASHVERAHPEAGAA